MTTETKFEGKVDTADIVKVYSGKPGCACGCKGNYFEDARNIKRVVGMINDAVPTGKVTTGEGFTGATFYSYETANRYFWAYTKEKGA